VFLEFAFFTKTNLKTFFKVNKFKLYSLLALAFFLVENTFSQEIKVNTAFSRNQIEIGDTVTFKIEITKPANVQIRFLDFASFFPENFEIRKQLPIDSVEAANGTWTLRQAFIVSAWDSALYEIKNVKALVNFAGVTDTLRAPTALLSVTNPKLDADLKPNAGNEQTPFTFKEFWNEYYPYILGVLALIIAGLAAWYFYKKYKKKQAEKPTFIPDEPAHVIALRELEKLKEQKLWQAGKTKAYYTELTDILRRYIYYRFGFAAHEHTSHETLEYLDDNKQIEKSELTVLEGIFVEADMVKFAKHIPLPEANDQLYHSAVKFVVNTKLIQVLTTETKQHESV